MNSLTKTFKYLALVYCVCAIYGCGDSVEVSRIELTKQERNLFPYSKGQKIEFVHSNGYQFYLKATDVYYKPRRYYETTGCAICLNTGNYVMYEMKHIILTSTYPKLSIEIDFGEISFPFVNKNDSILSNKDKLLNEINEKQLYIRVNGFSTKTNYYDKYLKYSCSKDGLKCYDSIIINGKSYYNVVELEARNYDDSIYSSVKSVLYNANGLLQIKLSKDESYSIK